MNTLRALKFALCLLPVAFAVSLANPVDVETLASGGYWTRDNQLRDVGDLLLYGKASYFDIGLNYTPLPTQLPLKSQYGEHEGFAFRHHAAFMSSYVRKDSSALSVMLQFERSGWDGEDFLFVPRYNDFGIVRSVTTWGLGYTTAAGMQHQNSEYVGDCFPAEEDSLLYSWANLRYRWISLQANLYKTDLNLLRLSLDFEDRAVFGGASSGFRTYLPNIDVTMYKRVLDGFDEDFIRVNWEQNLYGQILYAEVSYDFPDDGFHSAALKYYVDPSRFFALELTCVRRRAVADDWDDLMFGWALDAPILRIGYNSASDYDHLFHARGTWIAELHFNLQSVHDMLFAKNGRQAAPLETTQIKRKNTPDKGSSTMPLNGNSAEPTKTLTATGVRYEKNGSEGGGK